jgi:hypothetical protein
LYRIVPHYLKTGTIFEKKETSLNTVSHNKPKAAVLTEAFMLTDLREEEENTKYVL